MADRVRAVVFAYHNMGVIGLEALLRHGYDVACVFSHADDPDENRWFASVADWCEEHDIEVRLPEDVNEAQWIEKGKALKPDFIFSFYYRKLLSQQWLDVPSRGAFNLHGSLLPDYRGCAPVNWAILRGETQTGVTLHHMIRQADAGDIVDQEAVPIARDDTALTLYAKLEDAARKLLDRTLPDIAEGTAPRIPQEESEATYFGRRRPADGQIDWAQEAETIYNLVRAVTDPYPGAFTFLDGDQLTIWKAETVRDTDLASGTLQVTEEGARIGTGNGALRLIEISWRGERVEGAALTELLAAVSDHRVSTEP
jgi:UDP-4-amino-4-deoxy-L-arabinose formyltransferase/UDP-glucuronic acid dehydrogenase (UDP-4-keto-hexauronic acid decarboxylating)